MDASDIKEIQRIQEKTNEAENWTEVLESKGSLWKISLSDVWRYRDLLTLLIRRDFVANYKQTILGPLWFFIQPIMTSLMYVLVFGRIAKISTDGIPRLVFYLAGVTMWTYFADCLTKTSNVFKDNSSVFGKVYFPRLVVPLSIVISGLVKFAVQLCLFVGVWLYFWQFKDTPVSPNWVILLLPLLVLIMGFLALGAGMIFSSLTNKYRDLSLLLVFLVQLLMYASCIIFPLSAVSPEKQKYLLLNPVVSVVETFRHAFLGTDSMNWNGLLYSAIFAVVVLFVGILVFSKVEKSFTDTV